MLKRTHEAFSGTFWLGGTLLVDLTASETGHHPPVNAGVAALGVLLAVPFSAGKNSPDVDHMLWPGPPKRGYYWRGHRGITHRIWFATLLSIPFLVAWWILRDRIPYGLEDLIFALMAGWWSHLFGDMIYGRILICGRPFGLGWTTGGTLETGKVNGRVVFSVFVDAAAKFFTACTVILMAAHLYFAYEDYEVGNIQTTSVIHGVTGGK